MTANVTPRRPVNGKQVRADRTRAMVIDETVRCVLEEGFGASSAKHITERAGVTWGVIQYHFGDRAGLLMAVVDRGFSQLMACLNDLQNERRTKSGRERTELVINKVADAFLSPTSIAALEILIATRTDRADVDQRHLVELFSTLTDLGRYVAEGLEPEYADATGNLIWTTLMGAMVAKMAVDWQLDVSRELRALTDVVIDLCRNHFRPWADGLSSPLRTPQTGVETASAAPAEAHSSRG
jgi:AcrR family transcriptional regulator